MTDEERRLGLEIYRELGGSGTTVDELLERPNLKCLTYTDREGQIIGFGGLAVRGCHTGSKSTAGRCTRGARGTVSSPPASSAWRPTWNHRRPEAPVAFG